MKTTPIEKMMSEAICEGVFPGGILLVSTGETILFHQEFGVTKIHSGLPVTKEVVFDLASLTKPLATTLAIMKLIERNRLALPDRLDHVLPDFKNTDKAGIEIQHLLTHTSGLPAYQPYFEKLTGFPLNERRERLHTFLVNEPLVAAPGSETCYSDIGFMILSWIIENISGRSLNGFVDQEIYAPLGIDHLFFPGMNSEGGPSEAFSHVIYAATEVCPFRKRLLEGVVHDDNAYALGGVSGHAGLFGTTGSVHSLLTILLSVFKGGSGQGIIDTQLLKLFLAPYERSGRTLGFDRPSKIGSSSGRYFSGNSVGHLGFTGTSFWMDLEEEIIVILLTNRVHPTRKNEKIKIFRPKIHDLVMETIRSGKNFF